MERQAKDGTVYKQVGQDEWAPVTRSAKDGTVYKKVGADAWAPMSMPEQPSRMGEALVEGVGKGASFGLLPYVQAAVAKTYDDTPYSQIVQSMRERGKGLREQHPNITMAGEIAGSIAPGSLMSRGIGMVGAKVMPQAVQTLANANKFTKGVASVARGAAEGTALGAAYTPDDGADINQRIENAKMGGMFGAAIPAAIEGIKGVAKGTAWAAKKGFSTVFGVDEDVVAAFLKDPKRYLNAPSRSEVVTNVQKVVNSINEKVEQGVLSLKDAKEAYKTFTNEIKIQRSEHSAAAKEALREGQARLEAAYKGTINTLKSKPAPTSLQPQVSEAVNQLDERVSQGSSNAFNILKDENTQVPAYQAYKWLGDKIDELSKAPPSDAGKAAIAKLKEYQQYLADKPEITGEQAKQFLQNIGRDVGAWMKGVGQRDDALVSSLKGFRASLDEQLKTISPKYAEAMVPVAKDTELLSRVSKNLGTPEKAVGQLSSVATPKGKFTGELLDELGQATGKNFKGPISDYVETQAMLKSPTKLQNVKTGLPEYQETQKLAAAAAKAKRAASKQEVARVAENSLPNRNVKFAQNELKSAQETKKLITGWNEQNVNKKIGSIIRGDTEIKKQLENLSKLADQDFVDQVERLRVNQAFERDVTRGSRNVNLWGIVGIGSGTAAGTVAAGPIGGVLGAVTGAVIDKYGPKMAKQILIAVARTRGVPTVQSLMKAGNISAQVAEDLVRQFRGAVAPGVARNDAIGRRLVADNENN